MELKGDLQFLIEKAWALHDGLTHEIKRSNSFCGFCSEKSGFIGISHSSFQEMIISIRHSLKQVENQLLLCQRLRSWQLIDKHAALDRLEESRLNMIERVKEYKGRSLDVLDDLNATFNNGKTSFDWKLSSQRKKEEDPNKEKKRRNGFIICCIRTLFEPWKWHKAIGVAAKLIVISASISSTVRIYHTSRRRYSSSQRRIISFVETTDSPANCSLDVFCGRG